MPHYLRTRRMVIALTVLLVVAAAAFGWWRSEDETGRSAGPGPRAGQEERRDAAPAGDGPGWLDAQAV